MGFRVLGCGAVGLGLLISEPSNLKSMSDLWRFSAFVVPQLRLRFLKELLGTFASVPRTRKARIKPSFPEPFLAQIGVLSLLVATVGFVFKV